MSSRPWGRFRAQRSPAEQTQFRPSDLARYIALSATSSKLVLSRPCWGNVPTPMLMLKRNGRAPARFEQRLFHQFADSFGDVERDIVRRIGEQDREFVTAVTRQSINLANAGRKHFAESAKCARTDQVSVLIVHQFETVEIEKQDRHWIAIAIGAVNLAVCGLQQVAYVVDLRHIIDERSVLRLVVSLGVAKSESGVPGDQLRAIEFSGPEGSTVLEQPQDADLLVAAAHRNRGHRSALDSDTA